MLDSEGTAALGICLVLSFLVSNSKGKFIDQIGGCSKLFVFHILSFNFLEVVSSDFFNGSFESSCLLILLTIVLTFEF